jgi:restriction system protein
MRKKKKPPNARSGQNALLGLGVIAILYAAGGVGQILERVGCSPESGAGIALVFFIFGGLLAAAFWTNRVEHSLILKVKNATEQHLMPLVRRRAQLVRRDAYGKSIGDDWVKEVGYFISEHIKPLLTKYEQTVLVKKLDDVGKIIFERVEAATRDQPAFQTFSQEMTPVEFETFCAEELRRAGWDARVTMQTRDQGVDVVAEKGRIRVVLQCKLFAQPVGNKSVQEAAAGRAHEQADYGIVVTNNTYTPAAEQLAATNGVLLLHYNDLRNLEGMLSQKPRSTPRF